MTKKIKTRDIEKSMYVNYLQKAVEGITAAENAMEKRLYNAVAVSAIHAVISAADAYCVYGLSRRCASEDHKDTEYLIRTTPFPDREKAVVSKKYLSVIRTKNMAEYEERLVKSNEAEKVLREAKEMTDLVKTRTEK